MSVVIISLLIKAIKLTMLLREKDNIAISAVTIATYPLSIFFLQNSIPFFLVIFEI